MSEIKLKSCPFCNGNTNIRETYDIIDWVDDEPVEELRYVVECDNEECLCYANTKMYRTKEQAIIAWNTRKPVENVVKKLEEKKEQYVLKAEKWKNKGDETENKLMNIAMTNMASCYKDAIDIIRAWEIMNDDVCDWTKCDDNIIGNQHERRFTIMAMKEFKFCLYCGKKIKLVGD